MLSIPISNAAIQPPGLQEKLFLVHGKHGSHGKKLKVISRPFAALS